MYALRGKDRARSNSSGDSHRKLILYSGDNFTRTFYDEVLETWETFMWYSAVCWPWQAIVTHLWRTPCLTMFIIVTKTCWQLCFSGMFQKGNFKWKLERRLIVECTFFVLWQIFSQQELCAVLWLSNKLKLWYDFQRNVVF